MHCLRHALSPTVAPSVLFSKLKLVENRLRTSMTQRRLENLAIMSTEPNILRETDFTAIISNFAVAKSRKVRVWSLTLDF